MSARFLLHIWNKQLKKKILFTIVLSVRPFCSELFGHSASNIMTSICGLSGGSWQCLPPRTLVTPVMHGHCPHFSYHMREQNWAVWTPAFWLKGTSLVVIQATSPVFSQQSCSETVCWRFSGEKNLYYVRPESLHTHSQKSIQEMKVFLHQNGP